MDEEICFLSIYKMHCRTVQNESFVELWRFSTIHSVNNGAVND